MRALTLLLLALIGIHQYYLPKINSILLMELLGLTLFLAYGPQIKRQLSRKIKTRKHLKGYVRSYHNPKENKSWRKYSSNIDVIPHKEDYFDKL